MRLGCILMIIAFLPACNSKKTLFQQISSSHSAIKFNNKIIENDTLNPLDMEFLYNGGGVAVGDFNNDGLQDLYFTASTVSNKLYINKGDFEFEDVTEIASVSGNGQWSNGAAITDINNDGLLDIYVCATLKKNPAERKNLLYVNQGKNKGGTPVFKEMAAKYGLADTSHSVQAAFFDYDNDGDLDMYLLTTKLAQRDVATFNNNNIDTSKADQDKLFRNDWSAALQHPVFTDVSTEAGITLPGYGLGLAVADINKDGWKDIYISNDFYESDVLYINQKNGSFINKIAECIKHTSQNSMGNDIADINNDGLEDIMTVDMNPADNLRKKTNMASSNYTIYQNMMWGSYTLQYVRNTLQLNQGPKILENDSVGEPVFSDIGFYAGVAETDWSWNPSIADFDNDGYRDILITNGYPRDVTDHDFAAFRARANNVSKDKLIDQIPIIKISNYAFKNKGNLQFENIGEEWGTNNSSFSNGAVYVDLDNDGDLDYVVNNINDEAFVYRNTINSTDKIAANYLDIVFKGDKNNRNGLGAIAEIYYENGQMQVCENSPYRGYLSTIEAKAHFGLGVFKKVDSIIIKWQNGKKQRIENIPANQVIIADVAKAENAGEHKEMHNAKQAFFTEVTSSVNIDYQHREDDFIDFNNERLLPHKLSQYGPGLASGDVDGNGFDDIFIGGTGDYQGKFFLQQSNGRFSTKELPLITGIDVRYPENMGVLLFDADADGDLDLYCANGSNQFVLNTKNYQDRLFINDGKANFHLDTLALPLNHVSKSCIKASDFDNDGDLDLFIGGRVMPGSYPMPVSSFIYRNDSKNGHAKFTDVTATAAKELTNIGMICDAVWTDFDNDGWTDLIVAGEWMPVSFFHNARGRLENITRSSGIDSASGWWNSISAGDFDNDGDVDYIAGNLGQNSFYRSSSTHPVNIYAKDFDNNKSIDAIVSLFLPATDGTMQPFPAQNRDEIVEQLPVLKKSFLTYNAFGKAGINDLFTPEQWKGVVKMEANEFRTCYIENRGKGKFKLHPLPPIAQTAPVYGMVADDYNGDGKLDLILCGNDFGTEVTNGRYDALNGLLLLGNGKGGFAPQSMLQSGIFIPGDAKALIKIKGADNHYLLAASQNRGPLKIFRSRADQKLISLLPADKAVIYTYKNGLKRKEELYWGSSFLSQSSRFIAVNPAISNIEIIDSRGQSRNGMK